MPGKRLRHGFTTGSAAAAGAKAGVLFLGGGARPREVEIPLPERGRLRVPIAGISGRGTGGCTVTVVKDAGDDPDVTHGAEIRAVVRLCPGAGNKEVTIRGGKGVGKVTRPGLPVPVGEWAINPAPLRQIRAAVLEGLEETGIRSGVSVTIEVPEGERIAQRTLNPRLGIVGGISILGTRGTVKPFSHEAYRVTVQVAMDVARAAGLATIALSTGGKSERYLRKQRPDLPEEAFIQVADYFAFSLREAASRGFGEILYACFFGKLVKVAQGHAHTHAGRSKIDFGLLSSWALLAGVERERAGRIAGANTAREALKWILGDERGGRCLEEIAERALASARGYGGRAPGITLYLFDFEGGLLARKRDGGSRS
ncbi:MAG: cobalt-precorrin-5B (C(1))-methyltransferase [Deltaproteobacteria bacterium]|nr:cobalt-precorrin-5B (C(1))-methyltransferase [Deltaproteobacteria bacterium]